MIKGNVILKEVVLIVLDQHGWSARSKLKPADLGLDAADIPPAELASLGSMRMLPPEDLQVFDTLRREAESILVEKGIRLTSRLYAVPKSEFDDISDRLDGVVEKVDLARDRFVSTFQKKVEEWVMHHPKWELAIRRKLPDSASVASKISFDWTPIPVDTSEPTSGVAVRIMKKAEGLGGKLFAEIADIAADLASRLASQKRVTSASFNGLRNVQSKLAGLSFVDTRAAAVSKMIGAIVETLPTTGSIHQDQLVSMYGLLHILSDADRIRSYGDQLLSGDDPAALVQAVSPKQSNDSLFENASALPPVISAEVVPASSSKAVESTVPVPVSPTLMTNLGAIPSFF